MAQQEWQLQRLGAGFKGCKNARVTLTNGKRHCKNGSALANPPRKIHNNPAAAAGPQRSCAQRFTDQLVRCRWNESHPTVAGAAAKLQAVRLQQERAASVSSTISDLCARYQIDVCARYQIMFLMKNRI